MTREGSGSCQVRWQRRHWHDSDVADRACTTTASGPGQRPQAGGGIRSGPRRSRFGATAGRRSTFEVSLAYPSIIGGSLTAGARHGVVARSAVTAATPGYIRRAMRPRRRRCSSLEYSRYSRSSPWPARRLARLGAAPGFHDGRMPRVRACLVTERASTRSRTQPSKRPGRDPPPARARRDARSDHPNCGGRAAAALDCRRVRPVRATSQPPRPQQFRVFGSGHASCHLSGIMPESLTCACCESPRVVVVALRCDDCGAVIVRDDADAPECRQKADRRREPRD